MISLETKLKQTKVYLEEVKKENRKYARILNDISFYLTVMQKNIKGGK